MVHKNRQRTDRQTDSLITSKLGSVCENVKYCW